MKVSEVIKTLTELQNEVGDVPVFVFVEIDGMLLVEDKKIEAVSLETEAGPQVAIAFTEVNEDWDQPEKPKFQVVKNEVSGQDP